MISRAIVGSDDVRPGDCGGGPHVVASKAISEYLVLFYIQCLVIINRVVHSSFSDGNVGQSA